MTPYREFSMHLRCSNCVRPSVRTIAVPRAEGAPSTVDEFIGSAAMAGVAFRCPHCESCAGVLVAVTMLGEGVQEEWQTDGEFSDVA